MNKPDTYPLVTIVAVLREAGLAISVGDLLAGVEALTVLDAPFETLEPIATSKADQLAEVAGRRKVRREQLIWLIQTLWARTEEERATIRRVLGRDIAPPPISHTLSLGRVVADLPEPNDAPSSESPRLPPDEQPEDLTASTKKRAIKTADSSEDDVSDPLSPDTVISQVAEEIRRFRMAVPSINDESLPETHVFQLEDTPFLDELSLANVWRRFRRPRFFPDARRIDADKSVDATIQAGGMMTIVGATRRVNQARLTLMLDAGSAMAPWARWRRILAETVHPDASRLDSAEVGYFATMPGENWYEADTLVLDPTSDDDMEARLKDLAGRPMLVFGEAGAARAPMRNMPKRLNMFLDRTLKNEIRPLIWINPMRKTRWQPFFRDAIASTAHADAFELSHTNLIAAIDRMREEAP